MDINTVTTALNAQVVAGDIIALDKDNKHILVGKQIAGMAILTDEGLAMLADADPVDVAADPTLSGRRRRRAPVDAAAPEAPVEPAAEPAPEGLTLNVSSAASTVDSAAG